MLSFDNLDAANRRVMGTFRSTMWERYGREVVAVTLAIGAFVAVLAWLFEVTG